MGLERVKSSWFASFEAKGARMTWQAPSITSGPVVQPYARMAEKGSEERGQKIIALETKLEHARTLAFLEKGIIHPDRLPTHL